MHEGLESSRHEPVVHEDVFLDAERGITALQVARAIAAHTRAQNQILRARRRTNRIGLHEPKPVERTLQRRRAEKTAGDGEAPEIVERHPHSMILPIDRCSRVIVPRLRSLGFDATFREFDGRHEMPPEIVAEALRWIA